MIDTGLIRKNILDLAIRGALTPNNSAEKKPAIPFVEDDVIQENDKLFNIPDNWAWAKIGWIMGIERGGSPRPIKDFLTNAEEGINWIKIGDVEKNGKYILQTKEKIKPEGERKSKRVFPGDFLLTNSMSFGRPYISQIEGCVHDGWLILRNTYDLFHYDYLYYMLSSKYMFDQFSKKASGSTVDNLNIDKVASAVVPVPPIEEQIRIVKKVEEIINLLNIIDDLQSAYSSDLEALKSKIIDAGIKGKLTEQLPEDGNAEDLYAAIQEEKARLIRDKKIKKPKALLEITEDEIPFEIPANWKWVRLNDIGTWMAGATPSRRRNDYYGGSIPWVKTGELNNGYIDDTEEHITELALDESSVILNPVGSVLIAMYGATIGKVAILNIEATTNQACCACNTYKGINNRFLFYYLICHKADFIRRSHGGAQPNISKEIILNEVFPLPPLNEQKRIIEKLDSIMNEIS